MSDSSKSENSVEQAFADFMETLSDHVRIVGGCYNEKVWEDMTLSEVFGTLYPNGITLGFSNKHIKHPFRISSNLRRSLEE